MTSAHRLRKECEIERLKAQAQYHYKAHKEALARLKQLQEWTNDFRTALFFVLKWVGSLKETTKDGEMIWSEVSPEQMCELEGLLAKGGFDIDSEGSLSIPMPEMAWHTEDSRHLRTYIHQLIELEYGEGAFVRSLSESPQERLEQVQQWLDIVSCDQVEVETDRAWERYGAVVWRDDDTFCLDLGVDDGADPVEVTAEQVEQLGWSCFAALAAMRKRESEPLCGCGARSKTGGYCEDCIEAGDFE